MTIQGMRLVLGFLFLVLAALTFSRWWLFPRLAAWGDPVRMNIGGFLALVFGGLNLARWYAVWSYRRNKSMPVRTPLQPDPSLVRPESPNPDLDFTRGGEKAEEEPRIKAENADQTGRQN